MKTLWDLPLKVSQAADVLFTVIWSVVLEKDTTPPTHPTVNILTHPKHRLSAETTYCRIRQNDHNHINPVTARGVAAVKVTKTFTSMLAY